MRLLVLGGTAFVGRQLVHEAARRGHEVTLFTRGQTHPGLFPGLERLTGDRELDLSPLAGRSFDAAIDTCGYLPATVRASAELLADAVERYVFVSSLSVYVDAPVLRETTPTLPAPDPESEEIGRFYGPLKRLSEQAVEAALPGRTLVIRPGLVVGPNDYTGRFGYWPTRVARGGEVLAPGRPATRIWLLDVRDLAEWMIRLVEQRASGTFNAAGPGSPLAFAGLLEECKEITRSDARFVWASDEFLLERGVVPYTELPLWVPELAGGYPNLDLSRAIASGLRFRPLSETIRAVLDGEGFDAETVAAFGVPREPPGLEPERERALLDGWHAAAGEATGL